MGQVSHTETRQAIKRAGLPPTPTGRQCSGVVIRPGRWTYEEGDDGRQDFTKPRWVDGEELPCRSGCSAYVPEVQFCAHHLPTELVVLGNARAELWASLANDVWEQVCAEYPMPGQP
jgi:hypothetical protein